ncbi:hypothetical protein EIP91_005153 [Steccherinum ochraceum]|uniref:Uncharacterized protein n=1 Tax=Steccherinum ochraceum TaxID=92696 RepID=A0A4R0RA69_9APHY|nr:hypothetical protein EIP91_005153 [Steccherinum ochraceum]
MSNTTGRQAFHDRGGRIVAGATNVFRHSPRSHGVVFLARAESIGSSVNSPKMVVSASLQPLKDALHHTLVDIACNYEARNAPTQLPHDVHRCEADIVALLARFR